MNGVQVEGREATAQRSHLSALKEQDHPYNDLPADVNVHLPSEHYKPPSSEVIVRNIASYLSLSEVESIGFLCSISRSQSSRRVSSIGMPTDKALHESLDTAKTPAFDDTCISDSYAKLDPLRLNGNDKGYDSLSGADAAAGFGRSFLQDHTAHNLIDDDKVRNYHERDSDSYQELSSSSSLLIFDDTFVSQNNDDVSDLAPKLMPLSILEDGYDDDSEEEINPSKPLDVSPSFDQYYPRMNAEQYEDEHQKESNRLKKLQDKVKAAVMSHPHSIRSYCQSSLQAATKMHRRRRFIREDCSGTYYLCPKCQLVVNISGVSRDDKRRRYRNRKDMLHYSGVIAVDDDGDHREQRDSLPTLGDESCCYYCNHATPDQVLYSSIQSSYPMKSTKSDPKFQILYYIFQSPLFSNVPLSILFDLARHSLTTTGKVVHASFVISSSSIHTILSILFETIGDLWSKITSTLHPRVLLDMILQLTGNSMGEVIVTGIQSVATGVGSAGTAAIHVFSHTANSSGIGVGHHFSAGANSVNLMSAASGSRSVSTTAVSGGLLRKNDGRINEKMFRRLSKIDSPARVISYRERQDEVLTQHAKKRVQRMMHYPVSLRPFDATIKVLPKASKKISRSTVSFNNIDFPRSNHAKGSARDLLLKNDAGSNSGSASDSDDESDSPFMCTPKSFPPTPNSRSHVLARGTRFTEDVVYLARDQLRLEDGLESENEQTRVMAKALKDGRTYAVFNAADVGNGINLTCGYHCASKVGNDIYCSVRGMIPVLRNRFVYFEMSVSTPALLSMMLHHASLSIGLSTLEMPLNALVGAWKGSVGLCSTGQILAGSQWCSPLGSPKTYGSQSHVGVLVYLDDDSAFETWDGVMVIASIVFNVNGQVVEVSGSGERAGNVGLQSQSSIRSMSDLGDVENDEDDDILNGDDVGGSFQMDLQQPQPLPLFVPRDEELYPTLTLHSSQTEVLCRFCAEDIIATSRNEIGAPPGVTVYAIDGSVMIDEENEQV